jgi:pilus assembly protein Flp/PilA
MHKKFLKFSSREEGQGLIEYALILVLVVIVVIAILLLLGPTVGNVFSNVVANLQRVGIGGSGSVTLTPNVNNPGCTTNCSITVSVSTSDNTTITIFISSGTLSGSATRPCNTSCSFNIINANSTGTASVTSSLGNASANW